MTSPELFSFTHPRSPEDTRVETGLATIPSYCIDAIVPNEVFLDQIPTEDRLFFSNNDTIASLLTATVPLQRRQDTVFTNSTSGRSHPILYHPLWYGPNREFLATTIAPEGGFITGGLYDNFALYSSRYNPNRYSLGFHDADTIQTDTQFSNALLSYGVRVNGAIGHAILDAHAYTQWLLDQWDGTRHVAHIEKTISELITEGYTLGISLRAHGTMGRITGSGHLPPESKHTKYINALEGLWVIHQELQQDTQYAKDLLDRSGLSIKTLNAIVSDIVDGTTISLSQAELLTRVYGAITLHSRNRLYEYQSDPHNRLPIYFNFGATQDTDTSLKFYDFDESLTPEGDPSASADGLIRDFDVIASDGVRIVLTDLFANQPRSIREMDALYSQITMMRFIDAL